MTRPGIEPRSPGPLANTLLIRPMARINDIDFSETPWSSQIISIFLKHTIYKFEAKEKKKIKKSECIKDKSINKVQ